MTDAFTPERMALIRAILAKATPGPWVIIPPVEYDGDDDEFRGGYTSPASIEGGDGTPVCAFGIAEGSGHLFENDADRQLIKLTRTDLPAALDEIERLSSERNEIYSTLHKCWPDLADPIVRINELSSQLSRAKAERDEAVGLLSGLLAGKYELALDRLCKAEARSFLSRREGRKDD